MNHKIWMKTESSGKYLAAELTEDTDELELNMLCSIPDDRLIRPVVAVSNGARVLSYNITGCETLKEYIHSRTFNKEMIISMLLQINNAVRLLDNFLLSELNLMLCTEYIFVDKLDERLHFCAYPSASDISEYEEALKAVLLQMLMCAEESDNEAILLCLRLVKAASKQDCRFCDIMTEIMVKRETPKNIRTASEVFETSAKENSNAEEKSKYAENAYSKGDRLDMLNAERLNADRPAEERETDEYSIYNDRVLDDGYKSELRIEDLNDNRDYYDYDQPDEFTVSRSFSKNKDSAGKNSYISDENQAVADVDVNTDKSIGGELLTKIIITQFIMLAGLVTVYVLKGMETVKRTFPIYVILAVCTALYFIIGSLAEKRKSCINS